MAIISLDQVSHMVTVSARANYTVHCLFIQHNVKRRKDKSLVEFLNIIITCKIYLKESFLNRLSQISFLKAV